MTVQLNDVLFDGALRAPAHRGGRDFYSITVDELLELEAIYANAFSEIDEHIRDMEEYVDRDNDYAERVTILEIKASLLKAHAEHERLRYQIKERKNSIPAEDDT